MRDGRSKGRRINLSRQQDLSPETKTGKNQKSVAVQIDKRRKTVLSRRIKLLAVRAAEFSDAHRIIANGPAIWGGCVTRRSIRAGSWYFSQKTVTVQGGYGALFAVMVQILLSITSVAVQGF